MREYPKMLYKCSHGDWVAFSEELKAGRALHMSVQNADEEETAKADGWATLQDAFHAVKEEPRKTISLKKGE